MLVPKRVKHRREFRGKMRGEDFSGFLGYLIAPRGFPMTATYYRLSRITFLPFRHLFQPCRIII